MLLGLFPEVTPPRPDVDDPSPFKSKVELSKATPAVYLHGMLQGDLYLYLL